MKYKLRDNSTFISVIVRFSIDVSYKVSLGSHFYHSTSVLYDGVFPSDCFVRYPSSLL